MQEKASHLLGKLMAAYLLRKHTKAWQKYVRTVREERKRKEERQWQALAACHVGMPESPPTAAWQCQQGMQALQVRTLELHTEMLSP